MKKYVKFLVFWAVNTALLYLATLISPVNYTLGNSIFVPFQAALFTGLVWNLAVWNTEKILKEYEIKLEGQTNMMLAYLGANFVAIWLMARFSFITGFGVGNSFYVLALALVANFVQYMTWRRMRKK